MSLARSRWSASDIFRATLAGAAFVLVSSLEGQQRPAPPSRETTADIRLREPGPLPDYTAELTKSTEAWLEASMAAQMRLLTKPEVMQQMARFSKGYVDALVREGFSRDEAIRIVSGQRIPVPFQR